MKKFLCNIFINWVCQFPQMLTGAVLVKVLKAEKRVHTAKDGREIIWWFFERNTPFAEFISGVSLAVFILLSENNCGAETIEHEHGHSVQSAYLGWLYLPVVGIYSAVFCNLWQRRFQTGWNRYDRHYWYYVTRWTERRADELGKVDRKKVLAGIPRPENAKYPAMENQRVA